MLVEICFSWVSEIFNFLLVFTIKSAPKSHEPPPILGPQRQFCGMDKRMCSAPRQLGSSPSSPGCVDTNSPVLHSLSYKMSLATMPATQGFCEGGKVYDPLFSSVLTAKITGERGGEGQYCVVGKSTDCLALGKFHIVS